MSKKNANLHDFHQTLRFCAEECENFKWTKCSQFSVFWCTKFQQQAKTGSKNST